MSRFQKAQPRRESEWHRASDEIHRMQDDMARGRDGGMLFGRAFDGVVAWSDLTAAYDFDACLAVTTPFGDTTSPQYAECLGWFADRTPTGYYNIVIKFADVARSILNCVAPMSTDSFQTVKASTPVAAHLASLKNIEYPLLRNVSVGLGSKLLEDLIAQRRSGVNTMTAVNVTFVILFALFTVTMYIPMIRATGRHVTQTQAALLMFNDDQLRDSPVLRNEVKRVLNATRLAGVGGSAQRCGVIVLMRTAAARLGISWSCLRGLFISPPPKKSGKRRIRVSVGEE